MGTNWLFNFGEKSVAVSSAAGGSWVPQNRGEQLKKCTEEGGKWVWIAALERAKHFCCYCSGEAREQPHCSALLLHLFQLFSQEGGIALRSSISSCCSWHIKCVGFFNLFPFVLFDVSFLGFGFFFFFQFWFIMSWVRGRVGKGLEKSKGETLEAKFLARKWPAGFGEAVLYRWPFPSEITCCGGKDLETLCSSQLMPEISSSLSMVSQSMEIYFQ